MCLESYNEDNDGTETYRPSNYYSDCLDMPEDYRD